MKASVATSAIVVAVLATVAIEETRIRALREDLVKMREIRANPSPTPPAEAEVADEPETTAEPESIDPPAPMAESRRVPDEFPEPSEQLIKELALSPYAEFHYELGLDNRQRAYLDHLLLERNHARQRLAQRWLEAPPAERPAIESEVDPALTSAEQALAEFLATGSDLERFMAFDAKHSERQMMERLRPIMDQSGLVLAQQEEAQLIDALHRARTEVGAVDWSSLEGLKASSEEGAEERFEKDWAAQEEQLMKELGTFLSVDDGTTVIQSRRELKDSLLSELRALIAAQQGSTDQETEEPEDSEEAP